MPRRLPPLLHRPRVRRCPVCGGLLERDVAAAVVRCLGTAHRWPCGWAIRTGATCGEAPVNRFSGEPGAEDDLP